MTSRLWRALTPRIWRSVNRASLVALLALLAAATMGTASRAAAASATRSGSTSATGSGSTSGARSGAAGANVRPAVEQRSTRIVAVGAENQYANVIGQIGGEFVSVSSVESNPNADPHSYEASPEVARAVGSARLVVQNGLGYDSYMNKIEAASPNPKRRVIDVQTLLGLPDSTRNPHLWYATTTMPRVAAAIGRDLATIAPAHASYFAAHVRAFDSSLARWYRAIAHLRLVFPHAPVATTEPVGNYLLDASGLSIRTPWTLQADVMNGVDPAPQAVTIEDQLLSQHHVRALLYNEQVTDSVTASFLALAQKSRIPVVGLYETMPTPGYDYQSWMLAETDALVAALSHGASTSKL